mmetsp:Transcript_63500/g.112947  ORF Transcript_63500/g.112947 Transcript_63500/m.112947 type:complete len:98 (-) Transcript_63500:100-393(-)
MDARESHARPLQFSLKSVFAGLTVVLAGRLQGCAHCNQVNLKRCIRYAESDALNCSVGSACYADNGCCHELLPDGIPFKESWQIYCEMEGEKSRCDP